MMKALIYICIFALFFFAVIPLWIYGSQYFSNLQHLTYLDTIKMGLFGAFIMFTLVCLAGGLVIANRLPRKKKVK